MEGPNSPLAKLAGVVSAIETLLTRHDTRHPEHCGTVPPPETAIAELERCGIGRLSQSMLRSEADRRDALPSGTVLREYTLETVIGHGGFGIVYRARHNHLGITVAVKEYLPGDMAVRSGATVEVRGESYWSDFVSGRRRFLAEARSLVALQRCPGVVECRDFFEANGTAYLVMEHVDGDSLASVLKSREAAGKPLREQELLGLVKPLLEGLEEIHAAGVWHRDIKPSNILIRQQDGSPVLIDFGAAKQVAGEASRSLAPYTPGYAAPEQVGGGEVGAWTDLYAVGAVLWRAVAGGNRPWEPPDPQRAELRMLAVLKGEPDPLTSAVRLGSDRFSRALLEAIDRCLALQARERVDSCLELLALLENSGGGGTDPSLLKSEAEPVRSVEGSTLWVALSFAAILTVALWTGWIQGGRDEKDPEQRTTVAEQETDLADWAPAEFTNVFGMNFIRIPAGEFLMRLETEGDSDARPITTVQVPRGFYLGQEVVTEMQWEAVMGRKHFRSNVDFFSCGADCPVTGVSWQGAQNFLRNLNSQSVDGYYRLPTEAEWEYAARAGAKLEWYAKNPNEDTECRTRKGFFDLVLFPVGSTTPNAWGLSGMLQQGVWVERWSRGGPSDSIDDRPYSPSFEGWRLFRGGCRVGDSDKYYYVRTSYLANEHGSFGIGFRVLWSPDY